MDKLQYLESSLNTLLVAMLGKAYIAATSLEVKRYISNSIKLIHIFT